MPWGYPRPTNSGIREGLFKGVPSQKKSEQIIISLASWVGDTPKIYL